MFAHDVDLISVIAPAGFGKTTLARRLIGEFAVGAIAAIFSSDVRAFAGAVLDALEREDPSHAQQLAEARASRGGGSVSEWTTMASDAWVRPPPGRSTFVFDNAEHIVADPHALRFATELLSLRPAERRVVFCSRSKLPRELTRHTLPHRTRYIGPDDLRLTVDDIRQLLADGSLPEDAAGTIERISRGWPIAALLLIGFLRDGRGFEQFETLTSTEYEPLFEYFADEYLSSLSVAEGGIIKVAAALDGSAPAELAALNSISTSDVDDLVETSPFLGQNESGGIETHPFVRAMVRRDPQAVAAIKNAAADRARSIGDFVRAAEILISAGDQQKAAEVLCEVPREEDLDRAIRLAEIVGCLDDERILDNPRLWARTIAFRYLMMGMPRYVAESRRVYYSLRADEDDIVRADVAKRYAIAMLWEGKGETALGILAETQSAVSATLAKQLIEAETAAAEATLGFFERARNRFLAAGGEGRLGEMRALFLDHIEAVQALRNDEYDRGISFLEEAVRTERRSGLVLSLTTSLANLAFESWLHGDDARTECAVHDLRKNVLPGQGWIWEYWLAAIQGDSRARPHGDEFSGILAQAALFQAAIPGPQQLAAAHRAVDAADRCGDVPVRVLARIPLAEISRSDRSRAIDEMLSISASLELPCFVSAVRSYAKGGTELGAMTGFVGRIRSAPRPSNRVVLDLTSGRLLSDGTICSVSLRELAVLVFLAASRRSVPRDALCDAIWPEADAEAAANNLKVVIHRIRRKLGSEVLVMNAEGYSLGSHVDVGIREHENFVRALRGARLTPADRASLSELLTLLSTRQTQQLLRWDWYTAIEHRLSELTRQARLVLADDALEGGDESTFNEHVAALLQADPCDEETAELTLRFHATRGDHGAAKREVRRFAAAAAAEGDESAVRRIRTIYDNAFATSSRGKADLATV